ncbi:hypothetical protein ACVJBD_007139 [Rhizobium mongolense]
MFPLGFAQQFVLAHSSISALMTIAGSEGEVAPQVGGLGLGRQRLEQLRGIRLDLLREQLHSAVAEGRRHDRA